MNGLRYHALWDGSNLVRARFGFERKLSALLTRQISRYIRAMAEKYRCGVCELEESRCQCDKYCFMCQGGHNVRLCSDGMYYCLECREACDMQPQS